jgi:C4-dicarboxylate transporter, DctM subunit
MSVRETAHADPATTPDRGAAANDVVARLAQRLGLFAVAGMLAFTAITATDIVLRKWTSFAVPGANEVLALILPITIVACFPAGLAERGHLTISFLRRSLPPRLAFGLHLFGHVLLLIVFGLLAWRVAVYAGVLGQRGAQTTILKWPLAPTFWAVAALLSLSAIVQLYVVRMELLGRRAWLNGLAAPKRPARAIALAVAGSTALVLVLTIAAGATPASVLSFFPRTGATLAVTLFTLMWGLILVTVPLGAAMIVAGVAGSSVAMGAERALLGFGISTGDFLANVNISILPLFLMMGSFAVVAGLSSDIFRLAQALLGRLRGGLALATIGGCAGFGALTGLSVATVVTIGRVALPEMRSRGYSPALASGCVAAGGTLGILVPPSGAMILYALLTEASIGQMFIAALIPAAIAMLFYMIVVAIYVRVDKTAAPPPARSSGTELWHAVRAAWTVFALFGVVIGGIYTGVFTDEEAAAIGAGLAFAIALARGRLGRESFWQVVGETVQSTSMVFLLLIGGLTFSYFVSLTGLPEAIRSWITSLGLPPLVVIMVLVAIYLVLGSIMDAFAVMVITTPIFVPLVLGMGYDIIWWGIIMVMVIEAGLISPPFGVNVFVLNGMAPDIPIRTMFAGVIPFFLADVIRIGLLIVVPTLVLWLPSTMR